jgi:methionine-rich copper-binding protein CopC
MNITAADIYTMARSAIGGRTLATVAEDLGVSRTAVHRMLHHDDPSRPDRYIALAIKAIHLYTDDRIEGPFTYWTMTPPARSPGLTGDANERDENRRVR